MINNNEYITDEYELVPLQWDSELFKVSCAKLIIKKELDTNLFKKIMELCSNYQFVTFNNQNNNEYNNYLIGTLSNAFLVDVQVVFSKNIYKAEQSPDVLITNYFKFDQQIIDIAENNFTITRFYKDPNIDSKYANEVYAKWAISSFNSADKYFAVCRDGDIIQGFFLFAFDSMGDLDQGKGFMVVDKLYQGKGIGKKLISSLEAYGKQRGSKLIYGGTQVDNIKMVNHYYANGYKFMKRNSIYHLWNK